MTEPGVPADIPERLFGGGRTLPGNFSFAMMPYGERFVMVRQTLDAVPTPIDVVLNCAATLEDKTRKSCREGGQPLDTGMTPTDRLTWVTRNTRQREEISPSGAGKVLDLGLATSDASPPWLARQDR